MVELRERMGPSQLIVGVDRLDYTKGVPERLRGLPQRPRSATRSCASR